MRGQFHRLGEADRPEVHFRLDGAPATALLGDSLLTAILIQARRVRQAEFGAGSRAGFCLMAACQDCWVWTEAGERLRACDTPVSEGVAILTSLPDTTWPIRG